ncbi:hypothetical protein COLO4_13533 [Corchorus olitorius]|uniref:RRM domain-containing protein n=1 Tax=Corchorus olitorius TaxID=93759 RepID=A0A1R3JW64_9ROSI|nr:hypothetical protein COLO4_13533 [Corchorus olitorius]
MNLIKLNPATYQNARANPGENDLNNTIIFVGGLDPSDSEDQLKQMFSQLGEVHVKIPNNKNCGFVQYANRGDLLDFLGQPDQAVSIEEIPKSVTNLTVNLLPEDPVPPLLIC